MKIILVVADILLLNISKINLLKLQVLKENAVITFFIMFWIIQGSLMIGSMEWVIGEHNVNHCIYIDIEDLIAERNNFRVAIGTT